MEEQLSVVEKIQKYNHPSLAVGNKATIERWSIVGKCGSFWNMLGNVAPDLRVIDKLVVQFCTCCQRFPTVCPPRCPAGDGRGD